MFNKTENPKLDQLSLHNFSIWCVSKILYGNGWVVRISLGNRVTWQFISAQFNSIQKACLGPFKIRLFFTHKPWNYKFFSSFNASIISEFWRKLLCAVQHITKILELRQIIQLQSWSMDKQGVTHDTMGDVLAEVYNFNMSAGILL